MDYKKAKEQLELVDECLQQADDRRSPSQIGALTRAVGYLTDVVTALVNEQDSATKDQAAPEHSHT